MIDLTRHLRLLKWLSYWERLKSRLLRSTVKDDQVNDNLAAFYRVAWQSAAEKLGLDCDDLGDDVFAIGNDERTIRVTNHYTPLDSLATQRITRMKPVISRLLEKHRLPIADFYSFEWPDLQSAVKFLEQRSRPCVVKPAFGTSGGAGVTTGITTRNQLAQAAFSAKRYGNDLMIEEEIPGENYRLLFLDGELLDAVWRQTPHVVGDGRSTILELIHRQNEERANASNKQAHSIMNIDNELLGTLRRQGLHIRSVPGDSMAVQLKNTSNDNTAANNVDATALLCPEIIDTCRRACQIADVRLAGVDIICNDPAVPLQSSQGVILEINSPPGFYWHYHKQGPICPVAEHVLQACFPNPANRTEEERYFHGKDVCL